MHNTLTENSPTYHCIPEQHSAGFVPPVDTSSHACGLHRAPLRRIRHVCKHIYPTTQSWCFYGTMCLKFILLVISMTSQDSLVGQFIFNHSYRQWACRPLSRHYLTLRHFKLNMESNRDNSEKLQTFINKYIRHIHKIKWQNKITNKELMRKTDQHRVRRGVKRRKCIWIGHTRNH